jgi:hypothetical protein
MHAAEGINGFESALVSSSDFMLRGEYGRGGQESTCRIYVAPDRTSLIGSLRNIKSGVIVGGSREMNI